MPDITMCSGNGCPRKKDCYRAQATPSEYRQSYFVKPPFSPMANNCRSLWRMTGNDKREVKS